MKACIIGLLVMASVQCFGIPVKFLCKSSGPSGFWQDRNLAWNMQVGGWQEIHAEVDANWKVIRGDARTYFKHFSGMNQAIKEWKLAHKMELKHCIDQSTEIIAYRAELKAKRLAEERLVAIEKAIEALDAKYAELNQAYKDLVELYAHPKIDPNYKKQIEVLTKRIEILEKQTRQLEIVANA